MDGVIVLDKPLGMSSTAASSRVRRMLGARKGGHLGTLDPLASGVLPVLLGTATRLAQYLERGEKVYDAVLKLGERTDSFDAEGTVIECKGVEGVTEEAVRLACTGISGKVRLRVPAFSAVKVGGVPLYRLARKGAAPQPPERDMEVCGVEIGRIALPEASLTVRCSAGTYIRSLADEIGRRLGCGATLKALRRLRSGPFSIEQAVGLDEVSPAAVIPPAEAVGFMSAVRLGRADASVLLRSGRLPADAATPAPDGLARVLDDEGRLLGIGVCKKGIIRIERMIAAVGEAGTRLPA